MVVGACNRFQGDWITRWVDDDGRDKYKHQQQTEQSETFRNILLQREYSVTRSQSQ